MASIEDDERKEELSTLEAIYPEIVIDPNNPFSASLQLPVVPLKPLLVRFIPDAVEGSYADVATDGAAYVERDVEISHLPPIRLHAVLSEEYPANAPPEVELSTQLNWLPKEKINELKEEVPKVWEEYGRSPVLYLYVELLKEAVEKGFDLQESAEGCLVLPLSREAELIAFDEKAKQETFDAGSYDCGVCLEPKKGSACHSMKRCSHVFCKQCLQDFYNNAITEGDVTGVKCLDPSCGEEKGANGQKKRKKERTLHPRELLAIGLEESAVRRYVDMKRKKKMETDKTTVYCPRTWCQGPAKSDKYPPIPADLTTYIDNEVSDDEGDRQQTPAEAPQSNGKNARPDPTDRLAVCEKCSLAFCKVCYMGWHGPFARCYPRDPNELSAEEKASYEYIRMHTSPCPYCNAPVQKTMGCNHMNCFQCRTHFCYLCGAWLDANNPYQHFNKPGTPCYQRLWELEEGDEGQAPGDGRGFAGGARGWEQMAIDAARAADEAEADAAAAQAQNEENERAPPPVAPEPPVNQVPLIVQMAQELQIDQDELAEFLVIEDDDDDDEPELPRVVQHRGARRPRNPFPRNPPGRGAAQAVRNHERARAGGGRRRPQAPRAGDGRDDFNDRDQAELQRFLELARRDEEDAWDSGDDDDERFIIPHR